MIVTDILSEVFGYDKYSEITRELCVRGTFCDLATRVDGNFQLLIEVKAIGLDLKDAHIKQAVDYAANQGIEWVALTGLHAHHDQVQATNKFFLSAVVLSDAVLETVRRELRRLSDVRLDLEEIRAALKQEVIKREVVEGEKADAARKKVNRAAGKVLRATREKAPNSGVAAVFRGCPATVQVRRCRRDVAPSNETRPRCASSARTTEPAFWQDSGRTGVSL